MNRNEEAFFPGRSKLDLENDISNILHILDSTKHDPLRIAHGSKWIPVFNPIDQGPRSQTLAVTYPIHNGF